MNGSEISGILSEAFRRLAPTRGIVAAYLFGSHALGQARPDSDIDVAVLLEGGREKESLEVLRLGRGLEKITGLENIDIRMLNDAPLPVKGRIITEGSLLYSGNDILRVDFEVKTRSLYFDFLPHLKYLRQAFIRRAAEKGL